MRSSVFLAVICSLVCLVPVQNACARLSEQEMEQLSLSSPDFARANSDLNAAWSDVYRNSQCPAGWKEDLLRQQRRWVNSARDAEAEKYMSQGMDRSVAYTLATENRARELRGMEGCRGGQTSAAQEYTGQIFEEETQGRRRLVLANPSFDGAAVLGSYSELSKETQLCLARAAASREMITISAAEDSSAEPLEEDSPSMVYMDPQSVRCVGEASSAREQPAEEESPSTGEEKSFSSEPGSGTYAEAEEDSEEEQQPEKEITAPVQINLPAPWEPLADPEQVNGQIHLAYTTPDYESFIAINMGLRKGKSARQLAGLMADPFSSGGTHLDDLSQHGDAWIFHFGGQGADGYCTTKVDGEYFMTTCVAGRSASSLRDAESAVRTGISSESHPGLLP